ncbi:MAG: hypothetical protein H7X95_03400 [Deltaproteobacteria bacterium]|nr:hypothetical protein [Deltaproteobacteria bacterium]
MIGTLLIAVLVIAAGARATDAVRLRQQEVILAKLPTPEAAAFYRILRRRAWKVRILRAVALVSLVVILYSRNRARQIPKPKLGSTTVSTTV